MADSPNQQFIDVWNTVLVPKFTRFRDVFVRQAQAHSDLALARHPARPGERVLDVACGFGETTIQLAKMVAPGGEAIGLDACEPFLATARDDARAAGVDNVRFACGDAQIWRDERPFDLVFARFGVMLFAQPVIALGNLATQLRPGGRALFIVWRSLDENPGLRVAKQVARAHLPPPPGGGQTRGPGPFSMSDPDTVRTQLGAAGFTDVALEPIDVAATVGRTVDEALDIALTIGPAGEIIRDAGALGQEKLPLIARDLSAALAPWMTPDGVIVPSASWCISARVP